MWRGTTFLSICIFLFTWNYSLSGQIDSLFTSAEIQWIEKHKITLRFAPECFCAPLLYTDSVGGVYGLSVDYLREIERISGLRFNNQECRSLSEILQNARDSKLDLISTLKPTSKRKQYLDFTNSYFEIQVMLISDKIAYSKLDFLELDDYRIAVTKDYAAYDFIMNNFPHYKLVTVPDDLAGVEILRRKEADVLITDFATLSYINNELKIKGLRAVGMVPLNYNLSFACPKGMDTLVTIINKSMAAISNDTKNEIYKKWINIDPDRYWLNRSVYRWIILGTVSLLLIILFIVLWNFGLQKRVEVKTQDLNKELKLRLAKEDELRKQNVKYIKLYAHVSDLNASLEEAMQKSQESDRLKTAFLHTISHEIRTPLNAIIGFGKMLENVTNNPAKTKNYRTIICNSGNQLLQIVNSLLDISKIEAGQIKLNLQLVNFHDILTEAYNLNYLQAKEKGLEFSVSTEGLLPRGISDQLKLMQVLNNLIDNAIKFTNKGNIVIGVKRIDEEIQFFVRDTGKGIRNEIRDKIFDRFIQSEDNIPEEHRGAGLGLSICKALVELLEGNIWFESKLEKGTTFFVTIPYRTN